MKKYENFCAALVNLEDICRYDEPYDNVILTGLVGLYEICFEQSWKMMKEILGQHGFEEKASGSPRLIIKTAYQAGLISEEDLWLEALTARNNVAHAYNQSIALDIVRQTKAKFYGMFCRLRAAAGEWMAV